MTRYMEHESGQILLWGDPSCGLAGIGSCSSGGVQHGAGNDDEKQQKTFVSVIRVILALKSCWTWWTGKGIKFSMLGRGLLG